MNQPPPRAPDRLGVFATSDENRKTVFRLCEIGWNVKRIAKATGMKAREAELLVKEWREKQPRKEVKFDGLR